MWLSDTSVRRPVLATVINLLIIAFGLLAFDRLALREYPDIDPPIVTIETLYPGAASTVVETRITQVLEDRMAGIEGIKSLTSQSQDGLSRITVEFEIERDIDDAANDVRDRVSGSIKDLPPDADPPNIQKANADEEVILWLNLEGQGMSILELTDYAIRTIEDRFAALDGVARVRIGGGQEKSMRIWLDRQKLAARNLTVADIENALRAENLELPAGFIESGTRDFTLRLQRGYQTVDDFRRLVLREGADGYLLRLGDVARVEIGAVEKRSTLRGNGLPMVGVGIIKQSKANTLEVARAAHAEAARVNESLPPNMALKVSYDTSVFIERSIDEVYLTLGITILLVVLVIYTFLGNARATMVPALAVPVSLVGTFIILYMAGFTLNLLTLLALILAIGLVVDDAIIVIENIHRRVELGEPPLLAAYRGTRQVGFAVVATTLVLVAVFMPLAFLEGNIGRLFIEFAVAISAAVMFSGLVALTLSPMLASKLSGAAGHSGTFSEWVDARFSTLQTRYARRLERFLTRPLWAAALLVLMLGASALLFRTVPSEFAPTEDRGAFFIMIKGPEGTSFNYTMQHVLEVEKRLQPYIDSGEFNRVLMRIPGAFGDTQSFSDARAIVALADWSARRPLPEYIAELREKLSDIPGVRISTIVRQAFRAAEGKDVQFVLGGPTYEELVKWRDIVLKRAADYPGLTGLDHDFYETKPQIGITINRDRAGTLGVPVEVINRTLEAMLGTRRATTFIDNGEEYDVIMESEKDLKSSPLDIQNLYVRSERSGELIPLSNLVTLSEFADATVLNRYNRLRSITIEGNVTEGYTLGDALAFLEGVVREDLPATASIDYKGASLDYKESGGSVYFIFVLALVVVYLLLAGQFESFVHPFIIMLTVPMAVLGALLGLWLTGQTLNIYSQIGLIILIGLSAKNGILIVEFINQLRDEGMEFTAAVREASAKRFRPIIMTSVTTAIGAAPLVITSGAGAETRTVIGIVIITGVLISCAFTLFIIPAMYQLLARHTGSPDATARQLEQMMDRYDERI